MDGSRHAGVTEPNTQGHPEGTSVTLCQNSTRTVQTALIQWPW